MQIQLLKSLLTIFILLFCLKSTAQVNTCTKTDTLIDKLVKTGTDTYVDDGYVFTFFENFLNYKNYTVNNDDIKISNCDLEIDLSKIGHCEVSSITINGWGCCSVLSVIGENNLKKSINIPSGGDYNHIFTIESGFKPKKILINGVEILRVKRIFIEFNPISLEVRKSKDNSMLFSQKLDKKDISLDNFKIMADSTEATIFKLKGKEIELSLKDASGDKSKFGELTQIAKSNDSISYRYRAPSIKDKGEVFFVVKQKGVIKHELKCLLQTRTLTIFHKNQNGEKELEKRELSIPFGEKVTAAEKGVKIACEGSKDITIFKIENEITTIAELKIKNPKSKEHDGVFSILQKNANDIRFAYQHPTYLSESEQNFIDIEVVSDKNEVLHSFRLQLVPPPILLIHGLGGDGNGTWAALFLF